MGLEPAGGELAVHLRQLGVGKRLVAALRGRRAAPTALPQRPRCLRDSAPLPRASRPAAPRAVHRPRSRRHAGPVCAPADREAASAAMLEALYQDDAPPWHVLLAERLPAGASGQTIGGTTLQRESSPELKIGDRLGRSTLPPAVATCAKSCAALPASWSASTDCASDSAAILSDLIPILRRWCDCTGHVGARTAAPCVKRRPRPDAPIPLRPCARGKGPIRQAHAAARAPVA